MHEARRFPIDALPETIAPPATSIEACEALGKRLAAGKREVIFHQGDPATHLFCVAEGAVMVQHYLEDGRRQLVELALPGDICGLAASEDYSGTGETLQPSVLLACRRAELEQHPELGWTIERQIERQLSAAHEHAMTLGRMTAQERVCSLLARLAGRRRPGRFSRPSADNQFAIRIPMTRAEMGDYLGLSLETVCRTMSDLQRRGVIDIGQHQGEVTVNDLRRLKRLAAATG